MGRDLEPSPEGQVRQAGGHGPTDKVQDKREVPGMLWELRVPVLANANPDTPPDNPDQATPATHSQLLRRGGSRGPSVGHGQPTFREMLPRHGPSSTQERGPQGAAAGWGRAVTQKEIHCGKVGPGCDHQADRWELRGKTPNYFYSFL